MATHNSRVVDRCDAWRIHVYSNHAGIKGPDLAEYDSSKNPILTENGPNSTRHRAPQREMAKTPRFSAKFGGKPAIGTIFAPRLKFDYNNTPSHSN